MSQQLCLFKFERPLLDRFGADFFRAVPPRPGVYIFFGERGRVLYVGQSKNLRLRLSYYKNARPEREPRKIIRLVHQTRRIEVCSCETAEQAQLREVELIRERRPRFNTALASSRAYSFFGLARTDRAITLRLSMQPERREGEQFFGAYKNRGLCRRAFLALGRALWAEQARPNAVYDLPLWLHERARISEWSLPLDDGGIADQLQALLEGRTSDLLTRVEQFLPRSDSFLETMFELDVLTLAEFFVLAQRMNALREFAGATSILPQQEVDTVQLRYRWISSSKSGSGDVPPDAHPPAQQTSSMDN